MISRIEYNIHSTNLGPQRSIRMHIDNDIAVLRKTKMLGVFVYINIVIDVKTDSPTKILNN